jgi:ABC-2 type transport system permease protein
MSAFLHGLGDQLRLLVRLRRHRLMLLLFLGASALSVATYRQGAMRELPAAVYDADGTALSRTVVRFIDATPELRVVTDPPPTLDQAEAALTRGELTAVVLVPDGFTAALKRGRRAEVLVAVDLSKVLTGKTAQRAVARVLATVAAGAEASLSEKLGTPASAALARVAPISITEAFAGNPGAAYAPYVAPAFACFFVHVLTLFLAWTVFWPDAPERPALELLGRLGACVAVALAAALVSVYGIVAIDGLAPAASPPVVVLALLALVVGDVLFAAALRALFRGGLLGFQATVLLGMLSLMLSGLTWPWDAIPGPLRALALVIPFTPFCRILRPMFAGPVGLRDLASPLGAMALQAGLYLAVVAAMGLAERLVTAGGRDTCPAGTAAAHEETS